MFKLEYLVYKITCLTNNKIYVGQTTEKIEKRWNRHIGYQLKTDDHLHRAMRKYGVENFSIEVIDKARDQEELNKLELYYILNLNADYNINKTGLKCGGDTLSKHPNLKEISNKISISKIGSKNPNSSKVSALNIKTNECLHFDSIVECIKEMSIPRHDIVSKRCSGKIKSPYQNTWLFKYS